ncbi:BTAD domain-containing putative transcriptional regulator [Lichenicoccus sp.]|uniref:BTAD domain-containing putative transcriptional regulator n=1 Tax=Lichenicoccus sp. TaxID=2781899 RepID=UPI003D12B9B3
MSDYARPGMPKSDPSLLRLQLVGPMQALTVGNENVLPPGRKTRGLLAILAMSSRRPVLRSKLAEILWSRRSEEQARASLRQEIHRLLDSLSPVGASVVSVERHALALRPGLTLVDAERLLNANVNHVIAQAGGQGGAQGGTQGGTNGALPPLDGVLLEELNGTDPALDAWLAAERRRLREHALSLFEAALQRRPEPVATIGLCRQLLLLDPLHEAAWRGLIRTQLLLGDRGAALQSAERCTALFSSRVSGEPGPETSRLLAELRASMIGGTAPEALPQGADTTAADESASVEPVAVEPDAVISIASHRRHGRSIATLAVLPPLDLDAHADDTLVQALTEELVAGLADRPLLAVISGSALAATLALGRDDAVLRRNFGLDYVLDGTILRGRGRIRIILRLLDLRLQGHVTWARRFDCDPADSLATLDHVTAMVVAQLPWELLVIESRRIGARPVSELNAMQLTLRAIALLVRSERAANDRAGELLARAEALEPDQPLTIHAEAMRHFVRAVQFWGDFATEAGLAQAAIARDLTTGHADAPAIAIVGFIRGYLLEDPQLGLSLIDRALAISPTLSVEQAYAAFLLLRMGELDEAQRRFELYQRLTPLHPLHSLFDSAAVTIALLQGRYETAVALGRELIELSPSLLHPAIACLAAMGHLGLRTDAQRLLGRIDMLAPGLGLDRVLPRMRLLREVDRACLADGLRAAGMPDLGTTQNGHEVLGVRLAT